MFFSRPAPTTTARALLGALVALMACAALAVFDASPAWSKERLPPPSLDVTPSFQAISNIEETQDLPSLFFTNDEIARIDGLARRSPSQTDPNVLSLGAVLYFGPEDWTVWIRGERWTPETERPGLRIVRVRPDRVQLSITLQGNPTPQAIELRPYQTLRLSSALAGQSTHNMPPQDR